MYFIGVWMHFDWCSGGKVVLSTICAHGVTRLLGVKTRLIYVESKCQIKKGHTVVMTVVLRKCGIANAITKLEDRNFDT